MNFSQLKTRVLNRLSMTTDDPMAPDVDGLVNESLQMIGLSHPSGWPWLHHTATFTTTTGTASYAFSTIDTTYTIMKIIDVKLAYQTTYQPLDQMSPEEAQRTYFSTTGTDIPQFFWAEGQNLYLYPTPSAAYSVVVRTVIAEPDLVNDATSPIMPSAYHTAIVTGALTLYYEELQDTAKLTASQQRLDAQIARMERFSRETSHPPRIRYRTFGG